eukprot:TRINITY_DN23334_c0_g1_i1.p1 TRINITY_DN23334_c0_g1~~TRINITY_DN23334_c0_g1_i1.p1  ORF type:complete len:274 (-),score=48.22 TRINITY_DN23334_c0_g1_i1:76-897(-)
MEKSFKDEITPDEWAARGITKHRWMSLRDAKSTIGTLGFRVDGIGGYHNVSRNDVTADLLCVNNRYDAARVIADFVVAAATDEGREDGALQPWKVAQTLVDELRSMLAALEESSCVAQHEFIGTSVLLIADAHGHAGVSWIDFAKTHLVSDDLKLSHRSPWTMGNHEDGILMGLENLVEVVEVAQRGLQLRSRRSSNSFVECRCLPWQQCFAGKARRGRRRSKSAAAILSGFDSFSGKVVSAQDGHVYSSGEVVRSVSVKAGSRQSVSRSSSC